MATTLDELRRFAIARNFPKSTTLNRALLWRDEVIGWANLAVKNGDLKYDVGYSGSPPTDRSFKRELEVELDRVREFLRL